MAGKVNRHNSAAVCWKEAGDGVATGEERDVTSRDATEPRIVGVAFLKSSV